MSGCTSADPASAAEEVGKKTGAMACAGHVDVPVTTNYYGAAEDVLSPSIGEVVDGITHAAALEMAREHERNTLFAVSWVERSPVAVKVWLYDYDAAAFTMSTPITLPYRPRGRVWIARAGHDPACDDVVPSATSCAWFSWTAWGNVNWVAVGNNGQTSITSWPGFDGSGDIGAVESTRRQLRAYISPDRQQVLARVYQGSTPITAPLSLRTMQTNFSAYQTAVVWSARHQRWLVAWAENHLGSASIWNGKIHARWVAFDGSLAPAVHNVGYCEGGPESLGCLGDSPTTTASAGQVSKPDAGTPDAGGGRLNNKCLCKGFFVAAASEQYVTSPDVDAFRLHHYKWQARISSEGSTEAHYCFDTGTCSSSLTHPCWDYCPIDGLPPTPRGEGVAAYQQARYRQSLPSEMVYLQVGGNTTTQEGTIHHVGEYKYPQAIRTAARLSATVATDQLFVQASPSLRLTISDAGQGSCP